MRGRPLWTCPVRRRRARRLLLDSWRPRTSSATSRRRPDTCRAALPSSPGSQSAHPRPRTLVSRGKWRRLSAGPAAAQVGHKSAAQGEVGKAIGGAGVDIAPELDAGYGEDVAARRWVCRSARDQYYRNPATQAAPLWLGWAWRPPASSESWRGAGDVETSGPRRQGSQTGHARDARTRTDGERSGSQVWQDARDADEDIEAARS